jgi:hypothetical protein
MGLALHKPHEGFQKFDRPGVLDEALERLREQLMRVRIELAELKRTGSQQGLPELTSEALTLSMRIKRLEYLLEQA